jgi:hypothetical protein
MTGTDSRGLLYSFLYICSDHMAAPALVKNVCFEFNNYINGGILITTCLYDLFMTTLSMCHI